MNILNRVLPWRRKKIQAVTNAMFPPKYVLKGVGPLAMIFFMIVSMLIGGFSGWTYYELAITIACDTKKEFAARSYLLLPTKFWCQRPSV